MRSFVKILVIIFLFLLYQNVSAKSLFIDTGSELSLLSKATLELVNRGVLNVPKNKLFKKDSYISRAEVSKILILSRYPEFDITKFSSNKRFSDVSRNDWFYPYVIRAYELGIINGYGDGTFKPSENINTAEFLKMMTKTFGDTENKIVNYKDVKRTIWYAKYTGFAKKYKIFPSRINQLFPEKYLTRSDVAIAIYQYLKATNNLTDEKNINQSTNDDTKISNTKISKNESITLTNSDIKTDGYTDVLMGFSISSKGPNDITITKMSFDAVGDNNNFVGVSNTEDMFITDVALYMNDIRKSDFKTLSNANFGGLSIRLPKRDSIWLQVKGRVGSNVTKDYLKLAMVSMDAYDSNGNIVKFPGIIEGEEIDLSRLEEFSTKTSPNTPDSSIVSGDEQDIFNIKFQAGIDNIRISELTLIVLDENGNPYIGTNSNSFVSLVKHISVYDTNGLLLDREVPRLDNSSGSPYVHFDMGAKGIVIPKRSQNTLKVSIALNPISRISNSNLSFKLAVDRENIIQKSSLPDGGIEAYSLSTSNSISSSGILSSESIESEVFSTSKTTLSVNVLPSSEQPSGRILVGGSNSEALRFTINAGSGDIEIKKMTFGINVSGINVSGTGSIYEVINGSINMSRPLARNVISNLIDQSNPGKLSFIFGETSGPLSISNGKSKSFSLILGDIVDDGNGTSGDTMTISILGDSDKNPIGPARWDSSSLSNANFIWSDYSDPLHSSESSDFRSGWQVPGLDSNPYTRFR